MSILKDAVHEKKFDVRLQEKNLVRGVLTPKELDSYVSGLPNDAENAEWVSLESLAESLASEGNSSSTDSEGYSSHS